MNRALVVIAGLVLIALGLTLQLMVLMHRDQQARPASLIGMCHGQLMASAGDEDTFPPNCEWIEPIRYR